MQRNLGEEVFHLHLWLQKCKLGKRRSEEALNIAHFHNDSLQLGVVLDSHLAVLSAEAWKDTHSEQENILYLAFCPAVIR